jgi:hypothetical protein
MSVNWGTDGISPLHMHVPRTVHWHGARYRVLHLNHLTAELRHVHMHAQLSMPDQTYAGCSPQAAEH